MISNTLSIFAKILASENIQVSFRRKATPSFDTDARILTLPHVDDTHGLGSMFVAHEVGHALFTDNTIFQNNQTRIKPFFKYVNIIEDARIENKMKDWFPGATKVFFKGYTELLHLRKTNPNSPFIDRINEYFSFGYRANVVFSVEEQRYVDRIDSLQDLQDSIDLAEELWKLYPKKNQDDDQDDTFYKLKDIEIAKHNTTDALTSGDVITVDGIKGLSMYQMPWDRTYRKLNLLDFSFNKTIDIPNIKNLTSHMVNVFEMKKSAKMLMKTQKYKNGVLDVNKISSYRHSDNIFKSIGVDEKSKNHGVVFLLDWSSSMTSGGVLRRTIEQVIIMCDFLRTVRIPFIVSVYSTSGVVEVLSSDMKNSVFVAMCNFLLSSNTRDVLEHFCTPTSHAMLLMYKTIEQFLKINHVDKLIFICLTDGMEDDGVYDSKIIKSKVNGKFFGCQVSGLKQFHVVDLIKNDFGAICIGYSVSDEISESSVGYICPDEIDNTAINAVVNKYGYFFHKPTYSYDIIYCVNADVGLRDNKLILKHVVEILA